MSIQSSEDPLGDLVDLAELVDVHKQAARAHPFLGNPLGPRLPATTGRGTLL